MVIEEEAPFPGLETFRLRKARFLHSFQPQMPADMPSAPSEIRLTQRAPQSCNRCANRKVKCSKTIPCETCINLGLAAQCDREVVIVTRLDRRGLANRKPGRRGRPPGSQNKKRTHGSADPNPLWGRELDPTPVPSVEGHRLEQAIHTSLPVHSFGLTIPVNSGFPGGRPNVFSSSQLASNQEVQDNQDGWSPSSSCSMSIRPQIHISRQMVAENSSGPVRSTNSWLNEEALAENAAMTLECLAWGRQRDEGISPRSIMSVQHRANNFEFLNMQQSRGAIDFHRGSLTWMHNVIHWPTFYNECEKFWNRETVEEKSWLALYYAVLSVSWQRLLFRSKVPNNCPCS